MYSLMFAGSAAGAAAKTAVAPLERIKLLCQTGASAGFIRTANDVYSREGTRGFWRGNGANVVRILPSKGVLFMCNDVFKDMLRGVDVSDKDRKVPLTPQRAAIAGSGAGCIAVVVSYPLDVVRARLSGQFKGQKTKFTGLTSTLRFTLREEGVRGLYRGVWPTLVGAIPYEGIKFSAFDILCRWVQPLISEDKSIKNLLGNVSSKVLCGGLAGALAGVLTYPNDTLRRRLQVEGAEGTPLKYRGYWHALVTIVRQEGAVALYNGLTPSLLRMIPNAALQFGFFELFQSLLVP